MTTSLALGLYHAATRLAQPAAGLLLGYRARRGKEDALRIGERLGYAGLARPEGHLVWLHGASVGEALAILPLVERLIARGFHVLLTTGTVTSSRVLAQRLPPGALHQFAPLDVPAAVRRFYDHWRPDLVCFAESELWPNLIGTASVRGVPAVLVNARMSARSHRRWRRMPAAVRGLLQSFDVVLAQSEEDADRLRRLGARVEFAGNLKYDATPPPADTVETDTFRNAIAARLVWVAASTHAGEDELCIAVHARLAERLPGLLIIIVPRKPDRGPNIVAAARHRGLKVQLRSEDARLDPSTDVYVADTMGDIGLFYRLSRVVFVGKSLGDGRGGQNPIEPAKLGCAVLHGLHVANFAAVYADLDDAGGAIAVADPEALAREVERLFDRPDQLTETVEAAAALVSQRAGATDRTMAAIEPLCAAALAQA